MVHFGEFLKTRSLRSNSVTRQVSFNRTKIGGKCQIQKFKCDILSNFQTMCEIGRYRLLVINDIYPFLDEFIKKASWLMAASHFIIPVTLHPAEFQSPGLTGGDGCCHT